MNSINKQLLEFIRELEKKEKEGINGFRSHCQRIFSKQEDTKILKQLENLAEDFEKKRNDDFNEFCKQFSSLLPQNEDEEESNAEEANKLTHSINH